MSLTTNDLGQIRTVIGEEVRTIVRDEVRTIVRDEVRTIVRDEVQKAVQPLESRLSSVEGKVEALENDVKEIYKLLTRIERLLVPDKKFAKLSVERRLLKLNRDLLLTAKEAGVTLPR